MIYKIFPLLLLSTLVRSQLGGLGDFLRNPVDEGKKAIQNVKENVLNLDTAWSSFQNLHKYANPQELAKRKDIFAKNFEFITKHANDLAEGKSTFQLKITEFADLVLSEFNKLFNGYGAFPRFTSTKPDQIAPATRKKLPDSVDWRQRGAITEVKNQDKCAGCYAFAAAGAIEAHTFIKTNTLKDLSPQNLIDCGKTNYSMLGCNGGYTDEGFRYAKDYGLNILQQYPYEAKDNQCRFNPNQIAATTRGFVMIPEGDEKALAEAVATKGPVSVAINAGLETMQHYSKGIYYDEGCKNGIDDVNHAVLVVGYGEENGLKYWLIKNTYGKNWGEEGYLKLAKDRNNHCGVATSAYYPIV